MTESRVMRWAGHVERMRKIRNAYKIMLGSLKGRNLSEDLGVDGKIS
jgi:hypothetical protein